MEMLTGRLVTWLVVAVAALSAVSAGTIATSPVSTSITPAVRDVVVGGLAVAVVGCAAVAALPMIRRRIGSSGWASGAAALAFLAGLTANAMSLNGAVSVQPQTLTSILAVITSLAGATLAALGVVQKERDRRDFSRL